MDLDIGVIASAFVMAMAAIPLLCAGMYMCITKNINAIHSYHHGNVEAKNEDAYTIRMGIGFIVMSSGFIIGCIACILSNTYYGWIPAPLTFIIGLVLCLKIQKKYNGGLFS